MSLESLRQALPAYAKDLRLNLESVLGEPGAPGLAQHQIAMVAVASAMAARHEPLTRGIEAWAADKADARDLEGARTAAALMAMTNVYYRFTHLVGEREYETLRAGLRMNGLAQHGADKIGFELASLAASAINGCGKCMDAHEQVLRKHGLGALAIQSAVRIAAVIHAVAATLSQPAQELPVQQAA